MSELTDAEFFLLVTLDAERFLCELLQPIVRHEGRRQFPVRPSLPMSDAAEALVSLVARGLAEVVATPPGVSDIAAGRVSSIDEVRAVVADPANWNTFAEVPMSECEVYQAVPTPAAEAAYAVARGSRLPQDP
jgi:hypothetical protein